MLLYLKLLLFSTCFFCYLCALNNMFMKHIRVLLSITALFAILFVVSCGKRPDKQFSLNDVSSVTKVELFQDSLSVILTKTDSVWMVNSEYVAGEEAIDMLLNILNSQQVVGAVSAVQADSALTLLAEKGLRIKVYEGKKRASLDFTVYYTPELGFYGLVEGNRQAYRLQLPLVEDNPYDYLSAMPSFWRNNVLVSALPSEIRMVWVDDMEDPEKSFRINRKDDGTLELYDPYNEVVVENADVARMNTYLGYFNGLSYERMLDLNPEDHKSILLSPSPYRLSVKTADGNRIALQLFYISNDFDAYGNPLDYDPDRFYLSMNNGSDIALAKWVDFDLLLRELSYFVDK